VYGERAIGVWLPRYVVDAVGTNFILLEEPVPVIDTDRPEGIDRHVIDVQFVCANREIGFDKRAQAPVPE
jgi:hypothetical protein